MTGTDTAILGAGLAGLSTALHLRRPFRIFERSGQAGGLCATMKCGGFLFDYTGHLLHLRNPHARRLVKKILAGNLAEHSRNSWIYSKECWSRYPFQANLYGLPKETVGECLREFVKARKAGGGRTTRAENFKQWVYGTFGGGIARHFMIPYNEKLWSVPLDQITTAWMGRFVPMPRLETLLQGAYRDNSAGIGYNATFLYPKRGGIGALADAMAARVGNISVNFTAVRVSPSEKTVRFSNGACVRWRRLVSTIPLPELIAMTDGVPAGLAAAAKKLRCTSVVDVNLGIDRPDLSDKHWIYFPEKKFCFYRAGFYRNFAKSLCPPGTSSLYAEVSIPPGKKADAAAVEKRVVRDLRLAGILRRGDRIIARKPLVMRHAYVIHDKNRDKAVPALQKFLNSRGIYSIGRFGGWQYSAMEEAILEGRDAAEKICR